MTGRATIYDVATEAGVSISTVSLALNAPGRVSAATRRKVLAAVDALGFVPKPDAVARARRGAGRVGVIAPHTSYATVARRVNGVLAAAAARPVEVVLYDQRSAAESTSPLLAALPVTGRLDGLLVVSLPLDDGVAARLTGLGLATVLVDVRHPGFDSVGADDEAGGRLVADHLTGRGHRRLGFLGEAQRTGAYVSPSGRRLAGFRAGLADAGHDLPEGAVRFARHGVAPAAEAAAALLSGPGRPTAVFAADDVLAAGVLKAARALGLRVPEDVAVAGFDDGELAEALELTTVRQPLEESGRAAMERLLQRLESPAAPARETTLALRLVERATT
ncbi:LacI family transcriptional regulator [Sphaerisporangium siamense]|uniref:LacI family transcriptional regulator n=1 Tax=Sphaerisporangium siamense TaxID=795645 RepID=A0A7W7GA82_9ACTN|nr:LacI family DNA-binding transcriptional regulator [Sphaerisporangium siamense]MBB4703658.1 LacI family transcriptional regulator [Sphaerisporangium siamense]GII82130.1 LacI family transcriptional regulator [Sphaerisporangium siamense]